MKKNTTILTATFFFFTTCLLSFFSFAQAPAMQWEKATGGSGGDYVNSVVEANNGGYVFAGTSGSSNGDCPVNLGSGDGMIYKLDISGNLKWIKIFGGAAIDQLPYITKTKDGGYIAVGYTDSPTIPSYHAGDDVWIVKTDSAGNLQWQKCYGGSASDRGTASIYQMADGNYLFCGSSSSNDGDVSGYHGGGGDMWVAKIDSGNAHNVIWQKCIGGSNGGCNAKQAIETNDGGIVVVGLAFATNGDATGNNGAEDGLITKLNSAGNTILWEHCIGGISNDNFWSVVQLADSSFALSGTSNSTTIPGNHAGSNDYWFVNLSANGNNILWQKCFGGSGIDNGLNAVVCSDGKFIATGRAGSSDGDETGFHGSEDFWVVKFDASGVIWQESLGGTSYDGGNMIIQTSDGGYIIAGETSSADGDVTGIHGSSPYQEDAWVVKLASDAITDIKNNVTTTDRFIVHPNPSNGKITLVFPNEMQQNNLVEVYNLQGEKVYTNTHCSINIDLSFLPNGFYFLQTKIDGKNFTNKISLISQN